MILSLRPSEIRYSQDSIGNTFGSYTRHPYRQIGCTLDDILTGRCSVEDIPTITVSKRNGQWYTGDNRRLWVFRKVEEFGFIDKIPVYEGYISGCKFTTFNEGISVRVRGYEGGQKWRSMSPKIKIPPPSFESSSDKIVSKDIQNYTSDQKQSSETVSIDSDVSSEIEKCPTLKSEELPAYTCIDNEQEKHKKVSGLGILGQSNSIEFKEGCEKSILETDLRESLHQRCQSDSSFDVSQVNSFRNISALFISSKTDNEVILENRNDSDVLQVENPAFEDVDGEKAHTAHVIMSIPDMQNEPNLENHCKIGCCVIL